MTIAVYNGVVRLLATLQIDVEPESISTTSTSSRCPRNEERTVCESRRLPYYVARSMLIIRGHQIFQLCGH